MDADVIYAKPEHPCDWFACPCGEGPEPCPGPDGRPLCAEDRFEEGDGPLGLMRPEERPE